MEGFFKSVLNMLHKHTTLLVYFCVSDTITKIGALRAKYVSININALNALNINVLIVLLNI